MRTDEGREGGREGGREAFQHVQVRELVERQMQVQVLGSEILSTILNEHLSGRN